MPVVNRNDFASAQPYRTLFDVVNHVDRMFHDSIVMFDDLFSQSGFSLDRCRSFLSIVDAGGITQASGGNASRQSQLSRQLSELEGWLGSKLIVRGRGRFVLTESGKRLATLLHTHFSGLSRLRADCSGTLQTIRVGGGESLQQWITVPALADAGKVWPMVQWHMRNLRSEEVVSGLLDGELEIGMLRRSEVPKGLRSKAAGSIKYALFVPQRLVPQLENTRSGARLPLAFLEGQSHIENLLEGLSVVLPERWERRLLCTSLPQAAEAVRIGIAAAVLPESVARQWPEGTARTIPLPSRDSAPVPLALVWNPATSKTWPGFDPCRRWFESSVISLLSN